MGKPIDKIVLHRQRQRFSKDFKLSAIALLKAEQKPGTQIALQLGIARNLIYKWAAGFEVKAGDAQAAFKETIGKQ